jgi:hypothetical protein
MIAPTKAKKDSPMDQPFSTHSLTDADVLEQIGRVMLEHTRPRALLAVRAALRFQNDGLDPLLREHASEYEPRRTGTDDPDLCFEHQLR